MSVGYDLYGQAQTPFIGAGIDGLPSSGHGPHQLIPYMPTTHLTAGGPGGRRQRKLLKI